MSLLTDVRKRSRVRFRFSQSSFRVGLKVTAESTVVPHAYFIRAL